MFEALSKTQRAMADELESTIASGMLPQSILFSGRKGSSRLTAALDLAFFLTGSEEREMLRSAKVMFISARSMKMETLAALSLYERQLNDRSRLFLIQTIRKTLLQYHGSIASLYDNKKITLKEKDEEGRGGTLFSNALALDAALLRLEDDPDERKRNEIIQSIRKRVGFNEFYTLGKKTPGATIDEIRAVQDWLDEGSDEKCIIIENPEDFTEGAKNSMLKMLEEPPLHSHLILLSEHPSRILPTILSRVRRFQFPDLSERVISTFIGDTFSIYGNFQSFDAFFFEEGTNDDEKSIMNEAASVYSRALLDGRLLSLEEENKIFSGLERISGYDYFRMSVAGEIEKALRKGFSPVRVRKAWAKLSEAIKMNDSYNMSIRLALDSALREAEIGK